MFVQSNPEGNLGQFPWPKYEGAGGAVAALANAIAAQRQEQTQNFQKTLAQSINELGADKDANEALKAAGQMEGLPSPGGLSGSGGLANYIKLVNAQKQAELADYYRSHGGLYDTQAAAGGYNPRTGAGGRGGAGGNTVAIYDDKGNLVANAPAGSKLAQDYLRNKYGNLRSPLTSGQATNLAKGFGLSNADVTDSSKQQGFQSVPGAVNQQGEQAPLPLSPDQTYEDATDVQIPSSTTPGTNVMVPKPALEQIKRGILGGSSGGTAAPQTAPASDQYPPGTRGRRGDTWFVKQQDGSWTPEGP